MKDDIDPTEAAVIPKGRSRASLYRIENPWYDIDAIRRATNLVDLIGEHVKLRRSGTGFTGLCPFHRERTPSFRVNPTRGTFHCFGCGASGDLFRFIERIESVTFAEALRHLAERAGIAPPSMWIHAERKRRAHVSRQVDTLARRLEHFARGLRVSVEHQLSQQCAAEDPSAETLAQLHSRLHNLRKATAADFAQMWCSMDASSRDAFEHIGRRDLENAVSITRAIVDLLAEDTKSGGAS